MATYKEWRNDIEKLTPEEAGRLYKAIDFFMGWPMFAREFRGQGFDLLKIMLAEKMRGLL